MAWTKPAYDRARVNKAAQSLLSEILDEEKRNIELDILNNWRSSHDYPLQCIKMSLLNRAKKIDRLAIVAQRIKRLPSIYSKLKREPQMKLTQMQDIGGCRAVVSNINNVDDLIELYEEALSKNPRGRPEQVHVKNYVKFPKPDGYRGIHLVISSEVVL